MKREGEVKPEENEEEGGGEDQENRLFEDKIVFGQLRCSTLLISFPIASIIHYLPFHGLKK